MNNLIEKIETLDTALFDAIHSQTSNGDRRSLIAVQRATAKIHKEYVYLEIGSHLGGSLQPYIVDERCKKIYSIDPRPSQQPDDRSPGYVAYYENNSTERMLKLLSAIDHSNVSKIECFDLNASEVDPKNIIPRPQIAFIDGEHTKNAVISDFQFCSKVIATDGAILFHDFYIIYPAIQQICKLLDKQHRNYTPLKLEDNVFAIFFDMDTVHSDPYLSSLYKRYKNFLYSFYLKIWLNSACPAPLWKAGRSLKNLIQRRDAARHLRST